MMNKKLKRASLMKRHETMFQCPICATNMAVTDLKSLICKNGHTFDIARGGYVNVTTHAPSVKYDKELFEARRMLAARGFFEPLSGALTDRLEQAGLPFCNFVSILDAGCGEGSHLARIVEKLQMRSGSPVLGVGLDLAKAGIVSATKQEREAIWCVADLAAAPFRNRSFDAILNILSPSNYAEFERLLSDDGIVLKVIPRSGHLKELRRFLYDGSDKQAYTSEDTAERFASHFDLIDRTEIAYSKRLDQSLLAPLIKMTPLSWRAEKEWIKAFLKKESAVTTVHLDILAGRKKTK